MISSLWCPRTLYQVYYLAAIEYETALNRGYKVGLFSLYLVLTSAFPYQYSVRTEGDMTKLIPPKVVGKPIPRPPIG